jgi:hypothetical protein
VLTPQRISGGERQALKALREISDAGANWLWGSRPYKELETKSDAQGRYSTGVSI